MGFCDTFISACKTFSQWDDRTFYESNIKRIQCWETDEARRKSERRARKRMKQSEVIVAEMQMMRKEKSIRMVNDCMMKNKMVWEQWQRTKQDRSRKGDAGGLENGEGIG